MKTRKGKVEIDTIAWECPRDQQLATIIHAAILSLGKYRESFRAARNEIPHAEKERQAPGRLGASPRFSAGNFSTAGRLTSPSDRST